MTTICKNAFAKVNTSLVLGKKRHDGYHEIKTVMLQISLHDKIEFRQTEEKSSLEIKGELSGGISVLEDNLILKALNNIKKIAQINDNYKIILTKNIPSQAGLGGGSSDAGAVISFIKEKYNLPIEYAQKSAEETGSDVPFFLYGGRALSEGRGEIITPLPNIEKLYLILIIPNFGISTPEAYGLWDKYALKHEITDNIKIDTNIFENDFEKALKEKYPQIEEIKNMLKSEKATHALLTGSGSTVCGFFNSEKIRDIAFDNLKKHINLEYKMIISETL